MEIRDWLARKAVKEIIDQADVAVEGEFRTEVQTHAPWKPMRSVHLEDGRLIFWASSWRPSVSARR